MSFNVLAVRPVDDTDDDALYPVASPDSSRLIRTDEFDGDTVLALLANKITVNEVHAGTLKRVSELSDIKVEVYLTDSRLALACEKYDKGGGWSGFGTGALVALAANGVSKALAARRRRDKLLVGHVRYPWLRAVGASSKSGFLSDEALRLRMVENWSGQSRTVCLDLTLPKTTNAAAAAQEIARRAARYRLANDKSMADDERARFTALTQARRLTPAPRTFAFHEMPSSYFVSRSSAFPEPGQEIPNVESAR